MAVHNVMEGQILRAQRLFKSPQQRSLTSGNPILKKGKKRYDLDMAK
jgi:hypothetical protein